MTPSQHTQLKSAVKLLKKIVKKEFGECKDYAFQCATCQVNRLIQDLDSFVNFYLKDTEDKESLKRYRKQLIDTWTSPLEKTKKKYGRK